MPLLALKLVLTPAILIAATLVGRRRGPAFSGWLVALPLTSGPVVFFLAIEQGPAFAATAALGALAGAAAQVALSVTYARVATRGWPTALAIGTLAFIAASLAMAPLLRLGGLAVLAGVVAAQVVGARLMPAARAPLASPSPSRWDLPLRATIGTALIVGLTAVAPLIGPVASGLIATFPVFAAILAIFAHRGEGPAAATDVLRGLVAGLASFSAFFAILGWTLPLAGIGPAFAAATAAALAVHGVVFVRLGR